jgi:hypothetical protein
MISAVFWPLSKSVGVNASVVVTSVADPSERTSSEVRSPLAGWPVWPDFWKWPPAELKSPSHLPTE